jgi:hypothetical protein
MQSRVLTPLMLLAMSCPVQALDLRLEREFDAAGQPDPYVFEELEALYRARGDTDKAEHYRGRRAAAGKP